MSRIGKAYDARFRALLLRTRARKLEQGVHLLHARAQDMSRRCGVPLTQALSDVYEELRDQIKTFASDHALRKFSTGEATSAFGSLHKPALPRFLCDAGLGGLARWLRAAGYEAFWIPDIGDADLLQQARQLGVTVLTTDSLRMERRVLRDGLIPALWLPPTLTKEQQLALVFREFGLTARAPRCMSCGGELRRVEKESVRERIPPKTWRWLEEYFVCTRCDRLFWHGTHWQKIRQELEKAAGGAEKSVSTAHLR